MKKEVRYSCVVSCIVQRKQKASYQVEGQSEAAMLINDQKFNTK